MPDKLIHQGNLIALYNEAVPLRDGGETRFDIVKHPGGAVIAAVNEQDEICLLKQWRHAVQATIWEFPAGCLEPNEPPLLTAQRELEEEAGVTAQNWLSLGTIYPSVGFCNEVLHLFIARNLSIGERHLDAAEQLEPVWLPIKEAIELANKNIIQDAKTLALLLRLSLLDSLPFQ